MSQWLDGRVIHLWQVQTTPMEDGVSGRRVVRLWQVQTIPILKCLKQILKRQEQILKSFRPCYGFRRFLDTHRGRLWGALLRFVVENVSKKNAKREPQRPFWRVELSLGGYWGQSLEDVVQSLEDIVQILKSLRPRECLRRLLEAPLVCRVLYSEPKVDSKGCQKEVRAGSKWTVKIGS